MCGAGRPCWNQESSRSALPGPHQFVGRPGPGRRPITVDRALRRSCVRGSAASIRVFPASSLRQSAEIRTRQNGRVAGTLRMQRLGSPSPSAVERVPVPISHDTCCRLQAPVDVHCAFGRRTRTRSLRRGERSRSDCILYEGACHRRERRCRCVQSGLQRCRDLGDE
jgi:hypothetical protein